MFRHRAFASCRGYAPHYAFGFVASGSPASCSGPGSQNEPTGADRHYSWGHGGWHGPTLGVRRPLRYLAYKLDLDEDQVRELAAILDALKTARAQDDVDWRRSTSDMAGALEAGDFDEGQVRLALEQRERSAAQVREQTLECMRRLHRLLDPEQRRELAYLLRSGGVAL